MLENLRISRAFLTRIISIAYGAKPFRFCICAISCRALCWRFLYAHAAGFAFSRRTARRVTHDKFRHLPDLPSFISINLPCQLRPRRHRASSRLRPILLAFAADITRRLQHDSNMSFAGQTSDTAALCLANFGQESACDGD